VSESAIERERERELTGEGNKAVDGEDTGVASEVAKLAVRITREDSATVTAEEFDGGLGRFGSGLS